MKICLVTGEYPPMQGGVGDYTRELARELVRHGCEVHILTSTKAAVSEPGGDDEPHVQATVTRWDWSTWRAVRQLVECQRCDVINVQYQTAAFGMHPAINMLPWRMRLQHERPAFIVTFHDLLVPYLFPKAGRVRWWVNWLLARYADAAIVTNAEDEARLRPQLLTPPHLIPIGSNIAPQPPPGYDRAVQRRRLGIQPDETLLCYFGFLNQSKGGEVLFRTVAELVRQGVAAKLLMIGGQIGDSDPTNTTYLAHVQALAQELHIAERVLWTGFVMPSEVSAHLLAADVCVLPYRDGASFRRGSFMAALAHGLPIVSTMPHVPVCELRNGENILLVPADDVTATADAVQWLIGDRQLRSRLAVGAQELAARFSWEQIAQKTVQLYDVTSRARP